VVDDEAANIDLLSDIFEDAFEIIVASDGLTALELATDNKPDVILMDVNMPGIDGYEVCRRLKADPRQAKAPSSSSPGWAMSPTRREAWSWAQWIM
jgi:two-component system glycerol uptake and utilization response regulator